MRELRRALTWAAVFTAAALVILGVAAACAAYDTGHATGRVYVGLMARENRPVGLAPRPLGRLHLGASFAKATLAEDPDSRTPKIAARCDYAAPAVGSCLVGGPRGLAHRRGLPPPLSPSRTGASPVPETSPAGNTCRARPTLAGRHRLTCIRLRRSRAAGLISVTSLQTGPPRVGGGMSGGPR